MSRIGRMPITVPAGVEVSVAAGNVVTVKGPKGTLTQQLHPAMVIIGYSHQVIVPEVDGITIEVPGPNKVVIIGCDKQKVGQFAAEVREKRPPEPYKGKGIKYVDEVIRRKVGKTGAKK